MPTRDDAPTVVEVDADHVGPVAVSGGRDGQRLLFPAHTLDGRQRLGSAPMRDIGPRFVLVTTGE